jgi:8-oxo-dGTP pyrophosphatase MutT (NUDIX family)
MQRQLTATTYIVSQQRVLLIFHRKLKKWLPPGGHIDPNEIPSEAAKREAFEETGIEIELISDEHVWVDQWNAKSLPRPFLCLLEEIPAHGNQEAHQHIDLIYLSKPIGGTETINAVETDGLRWFTLEDVEALQCDTEIFLETQEVIRTIFEMFLEHEDICARKPSLSPPQDRTLEKRLFV